VECAKSKIVQRCLDVYVSQIRRIWNRLPARLRLLSLGRAYGRHLHALVRLCAEGNQSFATFFLRNWAELELMRRLVDQRAQGSSLDISELACSKGAGVYSILWTIRPARPDLRLRMHAVDRTGGDGRVLEGKGAAATQHIAVGCRFMVGLSERVGCYL